MKKNKEVMLVKLSEILMGDNPRQEFDETAMAELMQSMKHQGLLSPIGLRLLPKGHLKIVFGHRRYIAAQRLGWDTIEAIVVDVSDEKDALLKTSSENVIREAVSLPEQGRIFCSLVKKGMTGAQISVRMGCSKQFVSNAMEAYNRIPKEFHDKITYGTRGQQKKEGEIPATVALAAVDIRKKSKLTDSQVGELMEWAAKSQVDSKKMQIAGRLIDEGATTKEAIKEAQHVRTVTISLTMKIETIQKLQARSGLSIHDILYRHFEAIRELEILPINPKKVVGNVLKRKKKVRNK